MRVGFRPSLNPKREKSFCPWLNILLYSTLNPTTRLVEELGEDTTSPHRRQGLGPCLRPTISLNILNSHTTPARAHTHTHADTNKQTNKQCPLISRGLVRDTNTRARALRTILCLGRRFAALPELFGTNPRSHHKGATGRVRIGNQRLPVLCHCQLGQTRHLCACVCV